ncbi:MAG: ribonuclease III [endosymbiont of Galathealinum brachiosum]|uniref:Ribonuclease 3 n=1 Tax=endosymbiont of Galathealinum brachiosum TaxID=2200906 RepID=A0A370DK16_9GAMM|nr:MAG: ribonuclease III [endosymbiont of Galathealinum brachiosum]
MSKKSNSNQPDLPRLEKLINYQFNKIELLNEAVTHRSAGARNNERLEFLGDSILNFVIAADLFTRYPGSSEGDLSRLRASLVNKEGLFLVSQDLKLGDYLILGSGELKSGGFRRNSILADTVEAIFGAVYMDSDLECCRDIILRLYNEQLENILDADSLKDPKTRLQELLQSRKFSLPKYDVIEIVGKAHNQQFTVNCKIEKLELETEGKASNRRKAEQQAADKIIPLVQELFNKN